MSLSREFKGHSLMVLSLWFFSFVTSAGNVQDGYKPSILESLDVTQCSEKYVKLKLQGGYKDNDDYYHKCLIIAGEKSEKNLKLEYDKKLNEIISSDNYEVYDSLGVDKKSVRPQIISHFINEQKLWESYRDSFCQNAILGAVVGDSAFVGNIACTINMNMRRVEEIHLMYTPHSSWSNP